MTQRQGIYSPWKIRKGQRTFTHVPLHLRGQMKENGGFRFTRSACARLFFLFILFFIFLGRRLADLKVIVINS